MPTPPSLLAYRDEFISGEINHDFNGKSLKPELNEYQGECWETDTICTADHISNFHRRKADGDDDLCYQIFGRFKSDLKLLNNGIPTPIPTKVSQITGNALSTPVLAADFAAGALAAWKIPISQPVEITKFEIPKSGSASKNLNLYKILKYPNENFFIIDAVPDKIIKLLKEIQFPPVPDSNNGTTYLGAIPALSTGFNPNSYENFTIDMLNSLTNFSFPLAGTNIQFWPFRPKINIIHSPNTVADASTVTNFPGKLVFQSSNSFQLWHNWNSINNTGLQPPAFGGLPGIPLVENASKPFVFSWYYNVDEVSAANNPLMMSKFEIKNLLESGSIIPGDIGKFTMTQNWKRMTAAPPSSGPGTLLPDASNKNNPTKLKTEMKPLTATPLGPNVAPDGTSCPQTGITKHCLILNGVPPNQTFFQKASQCVQRKRSGDYLQIKTALEFPRNVHLHGNNTTIYKIMQAHPNAINSAFDGPTRLSGNGHLKKTARPPHHAPLPVPPAGMPAYTNDDLPEGNSSTYYKNRTYYVTGDWPAFLYCVFNKINCLLYCDGKCRGASGTPDLIFRAYFP